MATLYQLQEDYLALMQLAEEQDIKEEVFIDTLESIEGAIEIKLENYAKIIKNLAATAEAAKKEADRMNNLAAVSNKRIHHLKEAMRTAMISTGKDKVRTDLFSFALQGNPVKMIIDDEENIPIEYYTAQDPKLDTARLKEDVKRGLRINGVRLVQETGIRIR